MKCRPLLCCALVVMAAALALPTVAGAADAGEDWNYLLRIYAWLPSVDGRLNYSVPGGGDGVSVDAGDILDNLKMTFMGSALARKGKWSLITDLVYINLGDSGTQLQHNLLLGLGVLGLIRQTHGGRLYDPRFGAYSRWGRAHRLTPLVDRSISSDSTPACAGS